MYYSVTEVFVSLDENEDINDELKNRTYASFHKLSKWLETKYDGIIYPSIGMKIIGKKGECYLLFNHERVVPSTGSKLTGIKG